MARLVLHIGMHKAGSSAIQSSLVGATGDDFVYPRLGAMPPKRSHTDALVNLFSSKQREVAARYEFAGKRFTPGEADEQKIRQAAHDAGDRTVILSSEGAFTFLDKGDAAALKRFAEQLFEDVRVIAYVRDPFTLTSARFANRVRSHRLSEFTPTYKRYRPFENFDDVFGRDRVSLFEFNRTRFPNGDVVQHFCQTLGLKPVASTEVNVSPSRPAIAAIFRMNRAIAGSDERDALRGLQRARKAIVRQFPHRDWPAFRLSPDVVRPLVEENAEDLRWIEDRLGAALRPEVDHRDGDVSSEADLLEIDPRAKAKLAAIGQGLPPFSRALLERALAQ